MLEIIREEAETSLPTVPAEHPATKGRLPVQRSMFVHEITLPGTSLRGPQVMIVFDSLKCKSPKSWNLASEGRELNIEKYILEKYRIFPGWATAPPSCYIMCLLNIHSNFRERNIHICKTHIYRVFSPGWLSARLQSEQFCKLLLSSLASQGRYTFKVGCRMPFSVRWIFRVL